MTTGTGTYDLGMIHPDQRHPGGRQMAGIADVATINMAGVLACGIYVVVTGHARLTVHRTMIKRAHQPVVYIVAGIAIQYRGHVIRRLTRGSDTVVTTHTGLRSQHTVIHRSDHRRRFKSLR